MVLLRHFFLFLFFFLFVKAYLSYDMADVERHASHEFTAAATSKKRKVMSMLQDLVLQMIVILFLDIAVPNRNEKPLVKVSREELERELLIEPWMVIILNQSRSAESAF